MFDIDSLLARLQARHDRKEGRRRIQAVLDERDAKAAEEKAADDAALRDWLAEYRREMGVLERMRAIDQEDKARRLRNGEDITGREFFGDLPYTPTQIEPGPIIRQKRRSPPGIAAATDYNRQNGLIPDTEDEEFPPLDIPRTDADNTNTNTDPAPLQRSVSEEEADEVDYQSTPPEYLQAPEPAPSPSPSPSPQLTIEEALARIYPPSRLSDAQQRRLSKMGDIGAKWGWQRPPIPKDVPPEDIDAYLDGLWEDLQKHIGRKKRWGW